MAFKDLLVQAGSYSRLACGHVNIFVDIFVPVLVISIVLILVSSANFQLSLDIPFISRLLISVH